MEEIYQLKITIADSKPPIWRRVLVSSTYTLDKLHDVIQACFEWEHSHLYGFEISGKIYDDETPGSLSKSLHSLSLGTQQVFKYIYDFGDNWEHTVVLEKIAPNDSSKNFPYCLGGERAAPPEDCGGIWGYENKLEVLADKEHPDYEDILGWMGNNIEPELFDLKEVNERLASLRERICV